MHANCQGEHLARALAACPDFARQYEVRVYLNYARQEIPAAELEGCALFLYQHLTPDWGDLSSQALLARLAPGTPSLCIPNIFFRAYWPLWSGRPGFDFRDVFLDHLLDLGLPRRDILHLYLHTPLEKKYDLDALLAETIALESAREAHTPVKYLDLILERYRDQRLLFTINHPGPLLLAHAATGILRELGMKAPAQLPAPRVEDWYGGFEQPIHPQVAARYGLTFIGPETRYRVFGLELSFAQYAAAYVNCRQAGIEDFTAYLHLLGDSRQAKPALGTGPA